MKLNEINYYKNREIDQSEYDKIPSQVQPPEKSSVKGEIKRPARIPGVNDFGAFSAVTRNKHEPTVNKFSKMDLGYEYFVDRVTTDPRAKDNPHFPRFTKIVKGKSSAYYKMEALPMTLEQYIENDVDNVKIILNLYLNEDSERYKLIINNIEKGMFSYVISDNIAYTFEHYNNSGCIKNKKFLEALRLVNDVWFEEANNNDDINVRLTNDLHAANIMVRLTSTGPQLVITDPYSGRLKG